MEKRSSPVETTTFGERSDRSALQFGSFKDLAELFVLVDDITETNEFIEDTESARAALLSQEEIAELRAEGISAEELIQRQMERHERFGLKTDFSKEKWRKRKEKK